jgi:hypothetical protein
MASCHAPHARRIGGSRPCEDAPACRPSPHMIAPPGDQPGNPGLQAGEWVIGSSSAGLQAASARYPVPVIFAGPETLAFRAPPARENTHHERAPHHPDHDPVVIQMACAGPWGGRRRRPPVMQVRNTVRRGRAWSGAGGGLKAGARPANDVLPGLKAGVSESHGPQRSLGSQRSHGSWSGCGDAWQGAPAVAGVPVQAPGRLGEAR